MRARNFLESLRYAVAGIIYAAKTQRNLRFHMVAAFMVFSLSFYLKLTTIELLFVVFATFLVIIAEMLNTAVEAVVDLASEDVHPLARIAKDVAAGAVLISSINALVTAVLVLWPRLTR
ncbi:MAG: diacylglycerol kinase family protein [Firmicutes bacterium]|nr:diacylglycerol kinase family protein [Bacillota bacterium]